MSAGSRSDLDVNVIPLGLRLGAEVTGIDCSMLGRPELTEQLAGLLAEHLVLVFPELSPTIAQLHDLAAGFGPLCSNDYDPLADPAIDHVTVHRGDHGHVANVWHSDFQNRPAPIRCTILHMVEHPTRGGDTVWTDQRAVYNALSDPLQRLVGELTALHRSAVDPTNETTHPAVLQHPITAEPLLYVSRHHTVRFLELTADESRALLDHLHHFSVQPEFGLRHRWDAPGVAMWDNLATQHRAVGTFRGPRVFHRAMVEGEVLPLRTSSAPLAADLAPRTMVDRYGEPLVVPGTDAGHTDTSSR